MKFYTFILLLLIFPVLTEAQVLNIERERIKTDTVGWSGTGKLSLNIVSNLERLTQVGLNLHVQYKTKQSLYLALSDYEVIKSEKSDFSNKGMQHLRYNYKLNKFLTLEGFTQAQFNKVLNLKFRGLAGAGTRFKILGRDNFRIYSGLAYMFEHEVPQSDAVSVAENNHRLSSYVSFTLKLNSNFSLINTSYFQPRIDYFTDYRIANNLNMVFKITRRLSYALMLEHLIDNRPLKSIPREIYSLRNTLILDFGK